MGYRADRTHGVTREPPLTPFEVQFQAQAADAHVLVRAKEILCELWKQGRITAGVRFSGENILSAALHAVENPDAHGLTATQGAKLSQRQWQREQERSNEPF